MKKPQLNLSFQTLSPIKKMLFLFSFLVLTTTVSAQFVWTGSVNSDWNNAGNWNLPFPPNNFASTVLILPSGNDPVISSSISLAQVSIIVGAKLTIEAAGTLNMQFSVAGATAANIVNQGTVENNGTINITGSATAQGGILNTGTFINESTAPGSSILEAIININGTFGDAISTSGSFTNQDAIINIGESSSISGVGILVSGGTFSNVKQFINSPVAINIDDTGEDGIEVQSDGTFFHSAGSILIGVNSAVGENAINNLGTITAQSTITIARADGRGIENHSGATFTNSGTCSIGTLSAVGSDGVYNRGTFNNSSTIRVQRASGDGFHSFTDGQFNNQNGSQLLIGTSAAVGAHGVHIERGGFTNNGTVTVARANSRGLYLQPNSSFTNNSGKNVNIGTVSIGEIGIYTNFPTAVFTNNGGNIKVNNTGSGSGGVTNDGIYARNGAIIENKNGGQILIGQTGSIGGAGIQLFNSNSQLVNDNGTIRIDDTAAEGIRIHNSSKVENKNGGEIYIGENSTIGTATDAAIEAGAAAASVTNAGCSEMYLYDFLAMGNTPFTNAGFLFIDTDQIHTNTANLTNNGVINYVQDNLVPNVTNNDLIIAPFTITDCILSDIVQKGGANNFNPNATWFTNAGMTNAGGTYSSGTNVFSPSPFPSGTTTYYFQVSGNSCTFDAQIELETPGGSKTWTGAESTDWEDDCNWSPAGVPTSNDDVEIPNVANDPVIGGTTMAVAKSVEVQANAELNVLTGGSLTTDSQAEFTSGLHNLGTVDNDGTINIKNVGPYGLRNGGDFTNDGTININDILYNNDAVMGLLNEKIFTNNGTINIDDSGEHGLFNNNGPGVIFTNYGTLNIGLIGEIEGDGIINQIFATFNNEAGGEINIDNTRLSGIRKLSNSVFNNKGTVTILGSSSLLSIPVGIDNIDGTFNNEACATINIIPNNTIQSSAGSTFTNDGIIIENASGNSNITTNNGIVQNLNGGTFNIGTNNGVLTSSATEIIWTGCTDTDWDNASNWFPATVPGQSDEVVIFESPNDPIISGGINAVAKSVTVNTGATLTLQTGNQLNIDGSAGNGISNNGQVNIGGTLNIGQTAGVASIGILNNEIFINGGTLNIDNTGASGIKNEDGFENGGQINIGQNGGAANIGEFGFWANNGTAENVSIGQIAIDNTVSHGFRVGTGGEFFLNYGMVEIGQNGGADNIGGDGLILENGFLSNFSGAEVWIDNTIGNGFLINNNAATFNNGTLMIGVNGGNNSIGLDGISLITGAFSNESCALTHVASNIVLTQFNDINNDGHFIVNTSESHTNDDVFTNNGILEYRQLPLIPNVTNNEIIIASTSSSDCGAITSAFDLGAMVDLDILGIFTDENATVSAGTYDVPNNIFTPTNLLTAGINTFYVKIEDSGNSCEFIAEWTVETTVADVTWTGAVSSDWNDAGNWDIRVPTACDNVIIPEVGDEPEIDGITAAVAKSVIIEEDAYLNIENGGSLDVDGADGDGITIIGEIYNNGTINIGQSLGVGGNGILIDPFGSFDNEFNSILNIDNTVGDGIHNLDDNNQNGYVINYGSINIGQAAGNIGGEGIYNSAYIYHLDGMISVDNTIENAIYMAGGSYMESEANIYIGQNGGNIGLNGMRFADGNSDFYNFESGVLKIDNVGNHGIHCPGFPHTPGEESDIYNSGTMLFGQLGGIANRALNIDLANFWNDRCALINVASDNEIEGTLTIINEGLIIEKSTGTSSILENEGIVQNLNGGTFNITTNNGTLTASTADIWTGCVNSDWENTGNWLDGSVPTATDDVIISEGPDDPIISGGITAVAKSVNVNAGAKLTLQSGNQLDIDGATGDGITNSGEVIINGILSIGQTTGVGENGIQNNNGEFTNNGTINIDNTGSNGCLNNQFSDDFINAGELNIGQNGGIDNIGDLGIWANEGDFINTADGQIKIDQTVSNGVRAGYQGDFENYGSVEIGQNGGLGSIGGIGLSVENGFFENYAGSSLIIDNTVGDGFLHGNNTSISNYGILAIGMNGGANSIGGIGYNLNAGNYYNQTCATTYVAADINLGSNDDVINEGHFIINTAESHTNNGSFTNNGILEYRQLPFFPNVINNEIIIAPTMGTVCDGLTSVFDLGAVVDFNILGVFTDENATVSAGTYNQTNNTFTPTAAFTNGAYTFYVKIEDPVNGCQSIIEWTVDISTSDVVWTGNNGTDWDDAGNWDIRVPTECDNAFIPDVANDPIIGASTMAVVNSVTIQTDGHLTILNGGSLETKGASDGDPATFNQGYGILTLGTLDNSGSIRIGNVNGSPLYGIAANQATVNNNANASISIDDVLATGLWLWIADFNNYGSAEIGLNSTTAMSSNIVNSVLACNINNYEGASIKLANGSSSAINLNPDGVIYNEGIIHVNQNGVPIASGDEGFIFHETLTNTSTGEIKMDYLTGTAFDIRSANGELINSGLIDIGQNSPSQSILQAILLNSFKVSNLSGGVINIDNVSQTCITNQNGGSLINHGTLNIGQTGGASSLGFYGINWSSSGYMNNTGTINIDNTGAAALVTFNGILENRGTLNIGRLGDFPSFHAIFISGSGVSFLNNFECAVINIASDNTITNFFDNGITNNGILIENGSGDSKIFENNGIIQNLNGGTFTIDNDNGSLLTQVGSIWTGCNDTDWSDSRNWLDQMVPTISDDVVIPDVANDPLIIGSTNAEAKSVKVESGAQLSITASSSLTIDGDGTGVMMNSGIVTNSGSLTIDNTGDNALQNLNGATFNNSGPLNIGQNGGTFNISSNGIQNFGIFSNNSGGTILIDNPSRSAILNKSGIFTNKGTIDLSANDYGIENETTFDNEEGEIIANGFNDAGIYHDGGTFTNKASIKIGNVTSPGNHGIESNSTFVNESGTIEIDRSGSSGIRMSNSTFTNKALINIGGNASPGSHGMDNSGTFNNESGTLNIDRSNNSGIYNNGGSFNNTATVNIGLNFSPGNYGIWGEASLFNNQDGAVLNISNANQIALRNVDFAAFDNQTCAVVNLDAHLFNEVGSIMVNGGLLSIDATNTTTPGEFTNNGIIEDIQGTFPIDGANFTNNEIIISPSTAVDCNELSPAFDFGASVDFDVLGVFTDANATVSAGSYDSGSNTFTPTVAFAMGTTIYYVKIEDAVGGCERIVKWEVNSIGCCPVFVTCYLDSDGDSFGDATQSMEFCQTCDAGYVLDNTDCDDNDGNEFPGQVWYKDEDGDLYSDGTTTTACERPDKYYVADELTAISGDCNDNNGSVNPGASELCNGEDDNCNGQTDEGVTATFTGNAQFNSQADVDAWLSCYTIITGDLVINGADITDLTPLANINSVGQELAIYQNPLLTNLDGFENINTVGGSISVSSNDLLENVDGLIGITTISQLVSIQNNKELANLNGLSNLAFIDFGLTIINNDKLTEVGGLNNLTSMGDAVNGGNLTIQGNALLENLDGLGNLNSNVSILRIQGNAALTSIDGLSNVYKADFIDIIGNGKLPNLNGLSGITLIEDELEIKNNASLVDIGGLSNVGTIGDNLIIQRNHKLTNLDGFSNLTSIGGRLEIWWNDLLDNIDGLSNLSTIDGYLEISSNKALTNLDGLAGVNEVDGYIEIFFNDVLSDCCGIHELLNTPGAIGGSVTIAENETGCDSQAEINTACEDVDEDGFSVEDGDCDDDDPLEFPGQTWYKDEDGDMYSDGTSQVACERPAMYYVADELIATSGDCNDNNGSINPGASETCNGVDDNCDTQVDEGVLTTYYADTDMDGFGDPNNSTLACSLPAGYVTDNTDCDDNDGNEFPGQTWYKDEDGDFHSDGTSVVACERPPMYYFMDELTATSGDCDDTNGAMFPGNPEVCDGLDNDCNGMVDDGGVLLIFYADTDLDGFGDPANTIEACSVPAGYVADNTDCDDTDGNEFPGQVWYKDEDGDMYSGGTMLIACERPAFHNTAAELTATSGDCDDTDMAINPSAVEVCDGTDNDCDGLVDTDDPSFVDNDPPSVQCQDISRDLDANGTVTITPADVFAGGTDDCGSVNLESISQSSFGCNGTGGNLVTLTVNDGNGNQNTCQAVVTISDTTSPVAVCQDTGVELDANGEATLVAVQVDGGSYDNCAFNLSVDTDAFICGDVGANTVTLTATDDSGNSHSCDATVTVVDSTVPVALCQDVTVSLDVNGEANVTATEIDNGSTDNCGVESVSLSQTGFGCGETGANTVTLTVTDVNGLSSTCQATVTVEDNLAPTVVCRDISVQLDGTGSTVITPADVFDAAASSDNCGAINLISVSPSQYDCGEIGANVATLTAEDSSGNTSTCEATVTVEDFVTGFTAEPTPENCGMGDGTITVEASAPGGQVAYSIDGGASWQFTGLFNGLTAGSYEVTVQVFGTFGCSTPVQTVVVGQEGSATVWYKDMDGDGYTDGITLTQCTQPAGFVADALPGDCNDHDADEYPGQVWYEDLDDDGYGSGTWQVSCARPLGGYLASELLYVDTDCDDLDDEVHPNAPEVCNGKDDNCDGQVDEGLTETYVGNVFLPNQAAVDAWPACYSVIEGNLTVQNSNVTDLSALINITRVTGTVKIKGTGISDMTGLGNLGYIGDDLIVQSNPDLETLEGFEQVDTVGNNLRVYYNGDLTDCCAIHGLLANEAPRHCGGSSLIFRNDTGCDSETEVEDECGSNFTGGNGGTELYCPDCGDTKDTNGIAVYPNPASSWVTVALPEMGAAGKARITDVAGRVLYHEEFEEGTRHLRVDLGGWRPGMYLVTVTAEGHRPMSRRLLVTD